MATTNKSQIEQWINEYEGDPEYVAQGLTSEVMEKVLHLLEDRGKKNQTWLAETMGISRQRLSYILKAPSNMTFLTWARLAVALGVKPRAITDSERYLITSIDSANIEEIAMDLHERAQRSWEAHQTSNVPLMTGRRFSDATT